MIIPCQASQEEGVTTISSSLSTASIGTMPEVPAADWLNNYPRRKIGNITANMLFNQHLAQIIA